MQGIKLPRGMFEQELSIEHWPRFMGIFWVIVTIYKRLSFPLKRYTFLTHNYHEHTSEFPTEALKLAAEVTMASNCCTNKHGDDDLRDLEFITCYGYAQCCR